MSCPAPFSPPPWCAPNLTDYTTFLYTVVEIPPMQLPATSPVIPMSLSIACETVNCTLMVVPTLYTLAVYNLAADRLINYAPNQDTQTYFTDLRCKFRLNEVSVGVPSATADQGTSAGILNPEFMKTMTLLDLQTLKTPYGREYMSIALSYGPNVWGLS